jgi:predicted GNAT family acetyltransferase
VQDNKAKNRYELEVDSHIAYANYRRDGQTLFIDYVFAPLELRGTGAAGKLMQEITEAAQAENLKIVPICSYAASWLKRHGQAAQ